MLSIMRIALAGLLAGTAIAQGRGTNAGLPSCAANGCVTSDYGGCELTLLPALDIACICTRGDWIAGLACCVSTACDAAGQEATIQFANAICGSVGEADALPTAATCAPGTSPTRSASAGASSGSSGSSGSSTTSAPSSSSTAVSEGSTTTQSGSSSTSAAASATTTTGGSGASGFQAQGAGLVLGLAGLLAAL